MRILFLLILLSACTSNEKAADFSTADPNVTAPDSNAVIDTDNPYDSSYSVALDSNEAVILAEDTVR